MDSAELKDAVDAFESTGGANKESNKPQLSLAWHEFAPQARFSTKSGEQKEEPSAAKLASTLTVFNELLS
jgi:hypothetical protein